MQPAGTSAATTGKAGKLPREGSRRAGSTAFIQPELCTECGACRKFCRQNGLRLLGKLPFDDVVTKAQIARASVVEYSSALIAREVKRLWRQVTYQLGNRVMEV